MNTSTRISRWALALMHFDYLITYIPGKCIPHADALSRLRFTDSTVDSKEICEAINCVAFEPPVIDRQRLATEMEVDLFVQKIVTRVHSGNWSHCTQAENPFKLVAETLTLNDNLLYRGRRVFIPARLRREAFNAAHDTHAGYQATFNRMAMSCWWPGMHSDVERFVRQCGACNRLRPRLLKTRDTWPSAAFPFQNVHIDWAYVKEAGNVLIAVDSFSGWIEAFPCKDRSTDNVIRSLRTVFTRFGVPELLVSDNAPEFVSAPLLSWLRINGIKKLESPTYYPQANGAAERAVQTVKKALRAWSERVTHAEFTPFLQRVLFHHRNSPSWRGRSPAELVFGRQLRVPLVSAFDQGEEVLYKPTADSRTTTVQYVMNRGSNTAFVLDGDQLRLASNNQLAPLSASEDLDDADDVIRNALPVEPHVPINLNPPEPVQPDQAEHNVNPNAGPLRSLRVRHPPVRYVPG